MTTTRYITGNEVGVLTLIARAVDPNGNPIEQQTTITINPLPSIQKCYTAILPLGTTQDSIESACAQFGAFGTYYLGDPGNTVYITDSCSEVARDGFYKTEEGNWININSGKIRQRGVCAKAVRREQVRQNISIGGVTNVVDTIPPISVRIPGEPDRGGDFVEKPSFTRPAPTLVPPVQTFSSTDTINSPGQRVPTALPSDVREKAPTNISDLIARAKSLGIAVPPRQEIILRSNRGGLDAISRQANYALLRKKVQDAIDKGTRRSTGGTIAASIDPTIPDTNTEL